jgi:hypothetical protein
MGAYHRRVTGTHVGEDAQEAWCAGMHVAGHAGWILCMRFLSACVLDVCLHVHVHVCVLCVCVCVCMCVCVHACVRMRMRLHVHVSMPVCLFVAVHCITVVRRHT